MAVSDIFEFAKAGMEALVNDPAILAAARLGGKELGNAFDLGRDGSISPGMHELGSMFTATPGQVDGQANEKGWMDEIRAAGVEEPQQGRDEQSRGR